MTQLSNADKQIRFRKKEHLKRCANNIYQEWQQKISTFKWKSITPLDVQHSLDKAIYLPSGWVDKDYEHAVSALQRLHTDLCLGNDQLKNDVDAGWGSLITIADPHKYMSDNNKAIENARALASHLTSALRLSSCNEADQAAAVMEALRFVGRSLANNPDISLPHSPILPRSQAITMSLASINSHYTLPDWFAEELANTLGQQLDKNIVHQVGRHLLTIRIQHDN